MGLPKLAGRFPVLQETSRKSAPAARTEPGKKDQNTGEKSPVPERVKSAASFWPGILRRALSPAVRPRILGRMTTRDGGPESDITQALLDIGAGDQGALSRLFPLVYEGLRKLARSRLLSEGPDRAPVATPLVHEAYLALVDQTRVQRRNRSHFFAMASLAMRKLLVDYARARTDAGNGRSVLPEGDPDVFITKSEAERVLMLDAALDRLRSFNPRGADIVVCRFFAGLDLHDTAEALGVSPDIVRRDWNSAQSWLLRELGDDDGGG